MNRYAAYCQPFRVLLLILGFMLTAPTGYADYTSTNYRLSKMSLTAGAAAAISSSNYTVDTSALGQAGHEQITSASYKLDGETGAASFHKIPIINSVTPSGHARYYTDESTSIVVSAVSPDSQTMSYEAKQDGVTKDGPQASSTLTWALAAGDRGRRALSLKASDTDAATAVEKSMYVFRRPVK